MSMESMILSFSLYGEYFLVFFGTRGSTTKAGGFVVTLEQFAQELLEQKGRSKESLKREALSLSELVLSLTDSEHLLLEFDTLGQSFIWSPRGIYTFDELGDFYELDPMFIEKLQEFIHWRFTVLQLCKL